MTDHRQVSRGRLTAAGRASYELEARALAQAVAPAGAEALSCGLADATSFIARAVTLARLVLRLTDHRDGETVPEASGR